VKGRDGDPTHALVDWLAIEAATGQLGRRGHTATDLLTSAPPGRRRATASAGPDAPAGHLVAVFGHRLAELGGYDDDNNPVTVDVQSKVTEILQDLQLAHPDPLVIRAVHRRDPQPAPLVGKIQRQRTQKSSGCASTSAADCSM
jgi:hypothetical protein